MKEFHRRDLAAVAALGDGERGWVHTAPFTWRHHEEALHRELASAGLRVAVRVPDGAIVERGIATLPRASFARELARAIRVMPRAGWLRGLASTADAALEARRLGRRSQRPVRSAWERARLADAVAIAERLLFRRPNCLRRVLAELALDRGAATSEDLVLGLDPSATGHAWLHPNRSELPKEPFPVLFRLSPDGVVE